MVELTKELLGAIQRFREHFGDMVPLREIPGKASAEELIDAIDRSIRKNQNLLPPFSAMGSWSRIKIRTYREVHSFE